MNIRSPQNILLLFLIARDAIVLMAIGFALMLCGEVIFPGFIAQIIPLSKVFLVFAGLIGIASWAYAHLDEQRRRIVRNSHHHTIPQRSALFGMSVVIAMALFVVLRSFAVYEILLIIPLVITILLLITLSYFPREIKKLS